ncbi:hypothetical protein Kpho02_68510 [Kitasatospora phosalacinea]|uniref:DUF4034 domain-containing protein n=1 Tax=Kitasatospora phosalacinea TaxID=2065 RepID=A0A9W6V5R2_9ACTN|nr:DUF4034 domain-containing protein [Kitasatospora phosalacinea]GLW74553.1 hypothetical protein Kpho02_68510 [Kitasatospora phosalacinea]
MARLIVIIPLLLLVGFKLATWLMKRRTATVEAANAAARAEIARIEEATRPTIVPSEHGLVARAELVVDNGRLTGPELDAALAAATAGDWRPAAELFAAASGDRDRRWGLVGRFGENAAEDDAWLRAWRAERPEDADAALITLDATIELAWKVRTSKRASDVTREQFDVFHKILGDAVEAAAEAVRLADPQDPLPFVGQIPIAMGLSWPRERFRALWTEITDRDPHHWSAHVSALQYWCAKWSGGRGDHTHLHAFADAAIAAAPAGSLLTVLKLQAYWEQFAYDKEYAYDAPEVRAAADAVRADLAAADPANRRLTYVRGWLAYMDYRADRPAEAVEQFRALGTAVPDPWASYFNDPIGSFVGHRAGAVLELLAARETAAQGAAVPAAG